MLALTSGETVLFVCHCLSNELVECTNVSALVEFGENNAYVEVLLHFVVKKLGCV